MVIYLWRVASGQQIEILEQSQILSPICQPNLSTYLEDFCTVNIIVHQGQKEYRNFEQKSRPKSTTKKDESGDNQFSVKNSHQKEDKTLKSAILDVFDFDMSWLETEMKKVDWSIELTNPLQDYDFLKKKVDGFVIF